MTIDENMEFMFYTRTLSEDYRVFSDDGSETLDYAEEFAPVMKMADVESDDERSAVVFSNGGNVYVAAFGLMRGAKDRAGRDIRFSFSVILPESKRGMAMRIFSRVKDEWDEAGEAAGSLIKEVAVTRKDWKGRDVKGEDVRFNYERFLQWLTSNPANIAPPKAGYMLKYFADTGETVAIRTGRQNRKEDEEMPGLRRDSYVQTEQKKLPVVWFAVLSVLFVVSAVSGWKWYETSQTLYTTRLSEADFKSKFERANSKISGLKERLATVQESLNIKSSSLDIANQEIEKLKKENEKLRKNISATSGGANQQTQKKTEEVISPDLPSPENPASSGGCTGGVVSAGIIPLVYLASQDKGHSIKDNEEDAEDGGHSHINSNDMDSLSNAQETDNGGAGSEGSISQDQRGDDTVRSNDRNSNNEDQGGDDNRE